MKTTSLVAILIAGLATSLVDASPASRLNKRRAEQKRDTAREAAAKAEAQPTPAAAKPTAPTAAPAKPGSASPSPTPRVTGPTPAPKPAVNPGPSLLSREGKPPNRRFFSRLRPDRDRNRSRAAKVAKATQQPEPEAKPKKDLFYRNTWGPRSRRRHR